MPSTLEIQIGLHYYRSEEPYPDLHSRAALSAVNNLLKNGLIEEWDGHYRKSDTLSHWVRNLVRVPFPVIE